MFTAIVLAIVSALLTYVGAYPHLMDLNGQRQPPQTDRMAAFHARRTEDDKPVRMDAPVITPRSPVEPRGTRICDLRAIAGQA